MDFLGTIISGFILILLFMGVVYIAISNPGEVTVLAVMAVAGIGYFLLTE